MKNGLAVTVACFNFLTRSSRSPCPIISISLHDTIAISPNQVGPFNTKSSHCLLLNARSIRNKVHDLQALLRMDSFDIIAITETWLDGDFQDFELPRHGYNVYRKDRCNRRGGGVLVAVRCHLSCIHRTDLEVEVEMLALEIRPNPTTCVLFSTFFRPPNADESFLVHFKAFLVKYFVNLLVTGDFNFPHVNWNTCCPTRSDVGTEGFL